MGCLGVRLPPPYSRLFHVGMSVDKSLEGLDRCACADVAACLWDPTYLFLASQVLAWPPQEPPWLLLLLRIGLHCGGHLWMGVGGWSSGSLGLEMRTWHVYSHWPACGRPSWLTHH